MKKKLLALLLAVLMVVSVLPMTVLAEALPTDTEPEQEGQNPLYPAPAEDDYFQLLNAEGAHMGYYKTIDEADAAWNDNLTIRMLQDYALTKSWSVGATRGKFFSADNAKDSSTDPLNNAVFDGNGHKLYAAEGFTGTVLLLGPYAHWDCITFKNLTVVAHGNAVHSSPNAGGQGGFVFENCKLYGGNSYYLFEPSFYVTPPSPASGAAIKLEGATVRISFTGERTVLATWSGYTVHATGGCVELVDGLYYSHTAAATVYNQGNGSFAADDSTMEQRHITIHGGTYVNRTQTVVATRTGFDVYILGGTFIQTGENAASDATLSAISVGMFDTSADMHKNGTMHLSGGRFFVADKAGCTSTPVVMNAGFSYLQLLGNPTFYGPTEWALSGTTGELVGGVRVGDFNVLGTIEAAADTDKVTVDMPAGLTDISITPSYKQTVSLVSDYSAAEVVIYNKDKDNVAITALNIDGTGNGYDLTRTSGAAYAQKAEVLKEQLRTSFDYIPAYGKMVLQASILADGVGNILRGACGGAPITVDGQSRLYGFYREASGYMIQFSFGGDVTFKDLTVTSTHHGMNLGGSGMQLKVTLDNMDMKVGANKNSSFCINTGDVELRIINGTTVTQQGNTDMFQLRGYSRIYVKDSTLTSYQSAYMFKQTPDRRNLNQCGGYFDWIDTHVELTLDGATLQTPTGDVMRFFTASPTTAQTTSTTNANYVNDADHLTTAITAVNNSKLKFNANSTGIGAMTESELTLSTAVKVLDAEGKQIATAPSIEAAGGYMQDGYTIQLAKDSYYFTGVGLRLPKSAHAYTVDGNGAVLFGGSASNSGLVATLANVEADTDVTVKNLTVAATGAGVGAGRNGNTAANALTLENVKVYAAGSYFSSTPIGNGRALVVKGSAAYLRIIGDDTYVYTPNAGGAFILNYGQLGIYAGLFENGTVAACSNYINTRTYAGDTKKDVRHAPTTTIYGGTFIGSTTTTTMLRSEYGGTNIILGGVFILLNTASTPIIAGSYASTGYGYNYIYGGEFYSKSAGPIYKPNSAANSYVEFGGGTFYGQVAESNITNAKQDTKVEGSDHMTRVYFGTRVDSIYKVTKSTTAVTIDNKNGDYHLVDAANGTYAHVTTIGYDTANARVAAKLAAVGGDLSRIAEVADLEVTDGYTPISKFFFDFEIDRALKTVGDGGKVMLLGNITRVLDSSESVFYAETAYTRGIQGHVLSPYFSYTFTSKGNARYTLTVEYGGMFTDSYFAFNVFGGDITIENLNIHGNEETFRGLMEKAYEGNYTILTLRNATVSSNKLSAIKSLGWGGFVLNVCEGATIYSAGAGVEYSSPNGQINVYEGAVIGTSANNAAALNGYAIQLASTNCTANIYGGYIRGKNQAVLGQGTNGRHNIYGGELIGASQAVTLEKAGSILNVYGGKLTATAGNAVLAKGEEGSTVNVFGGTVSSTDLTTSYFAGIKFEKRGTVNVHGGLVEGYRGIWTPSGASTVTVTGGTVQSFGHNTVHDNAGSTFYIKGGSLVQEQPRTGSAAGMQGGLACLNSAGKIYFTGGTHTGEGTIGYSNNIAQFSFGGDATVTTATGLSYGGTVTGGKFEVKDNAVVHVKNTYILSIPGTQTNYEIAISGGMLVADGAGASGVKHMISNNSTTTKISLNGGILLGKAAVGYFAHTSAANESFAALSGASFDNTGAGGVTVTSSKITMDYAGESYYAWMGFAATDADYSPVMKAGAQVRMAADSNGLRFVSTISAETVAALEELAGANGTVTYGTLIVPVSYLIEAKGFTHAALVAADKTMVDIVATSKGTTTAQDGSKTIRAALVNIKEANYDLTFAAVSYAKVTVNGTDTYYYSAFSSTNNARSLRQTCISALQSAQPSVGITNGVYYSYPSIVSGISGYSRYNNAQQRVLAMYAGLTTVQ